MLYLDFEMLGNTLLEFINYGRHMPIKKTLIIHDHVCGQDRKS